MNLLKITTEEQIIASRPLSNREKARLEKEATWERLWKNQPEKLVSTRSARHAAELAKVIKAIPIFQGKDAVDLGCGCGDVSLYLAKHMKVAAVDIARNALKKIDHPAITTRQDFFPYTKLEDDAYELVVCRDLLAGLSEADQRLGISEIYRLLSRQGTAIISTPVDVDSEDAIFRFIHLVETELEISELIFCHHALSIKFPYFKKNRPILNILEWIGQFFWNDQAISYVIAVTTRKQLF